MGEKTRYDKSLGHLAKRFVNLIHESEDGVLDLRTACSSLGVKGRRRIYDITNVLEGIGVVVKPSKNCIRWKGMGPFKSEECGDKVLNLRKQIASLQEEEKLIDVQLKCMKQSIRNITNNIDNEPYLYLRKDDVLNNINVDKNQVIVFEAPLGAEFAVGTTQATDKPNLILHVKSSKEPINVILLNNTEDEKSSTCDVDFSDGCYDYKNSLPRLSAPISKGDYYFSLNESEGLCDLFDIPVE